MRLAPLTLVLASALLAAGCASKKGFEKEGFAFGCPIGDAKISSMDDLVKAKSAKEGRQPPDVEIEEMRCTTTGDLLKVDVVIYNDESDTERLLYKFRWADAEGMRAADEESWKPLMLYGTSRQTISTIAPNGKVRDFKFIVMGQE